RVTHAHAGEQALAPARILRTARPVKLDARRSQGERADTSHGVTGVEAQVHDHLLDLRDVADDLERPVRFAPQTDELGAQDPAQRLQPSARSRVEVGARLVEGLATNELEQLPSQVRGALG